MLLSGTSYTQNLRVTRFSVENNSRYQYNTCAPGKSWRWNRIKYGVQFLNWTDLHSDVIMSAMASQINNLTIVYSTVYSGNIKALRHWPLCVCVGTKTRVTGNSLRISADPLKLQDLVLIHRTQEPYLIKRSPLMHIEMSMEERRLLKSSRW